MNSSGLAAGTLMGLPRALAQQWLQYWSVPYKHRLPHNDGHYLRTCGYVEDDPLPEYTWAPDSAYENFQDLKFGIRVHWGLYSLLHWQNESWQLLTVSRKERHAYQQLYKSWNPVGFDACAWMDFFKESGARMFSFTTKHHDGFSMFDTHTRVQRRANWLAAGTDMIESCNHAFSIMETPFKRDVVRELCDAARSRQLKIDLYFSHPDWYDADFRPYTYHPLQVPSANKLSVTGKENKPLLEIADKRFGKSGLAIVPDPDDLAVKRMMKRHRDQLEELITKYGDIDMVCLDMFLGPFVWPQLRETMLYLRKLRPNVMYRARGIGNYGDYYTPEGFVPGSKENTDVPWFVIYPLGSTFSYEPDATKYKGARWIVHNLIDAVSKGGNFMAGIGPDGNGIYHPEAVSQLQDTGAWLRLNGEGIYATRARAGDLWKEGNDIRFTRSKDNRTIFAFSLKWPGDELVLRTVKPARRARIELMGTKTTLSWKFDSARGLVIRLPMELREKISPAGQLAYGFKIDI